MTYVWLAKYNDGTQLHQYNKDGEENLFKSIDQDRLELFTIGNAYKQISINLKSGIFNLNGVEIEINDLSNKDEKYRLIYFRRVQMSLGTDGNSNKTVQSFIGYQITINNKNYKVMFSELNNKICLYKE